MAHNLLIKLSNYIQEYIIFTNDLEKELYHLTFNQLQAMRRTLDNDENFFNLFFKDKTEKEVKQWIEDESKKW